MGFLDSTGLARVWSKISAALGLKMDRAIYDPTERARDVFAYIDEKAEAAAAKDLRLETVTLAAGGWPDSAPYTQTAAVPGILADQAKQGVWPAPASESLNAWIASEVTAAAQGADSLTFAAQARPEADIVVHVMIMEAT